MAWLQRLPKRLTLRALPGASGSSSEEQAIPQAAVATEPSHGGNCLSNVNNIEEVQRCQAHDVRIFLDGEQATTTTLFSNCDRNASDTCFMPEDKRDISWQDLRRTLTRQPPHVGATAKPRQCFQRLTGGPGQLDVDTVGLHPMEQQRAMDSQPRAHLRDLPAAPAVSDPSMSAACHNRESQNLAALNGPPLPVTTTIFKKSDACTVGEIPLPVATPIGKRRAEAVVGEARQLRARHDGSRDAQTLRFNTSERAASIGDSGAVSIDLTLICESQLDCQITSPDNPQPQLGESVTVVEASALPASSSCWQPNQDVVVSERSTTSSSSSSAAPVIVLPAASNEAAILQETMRAAAATRRSTEREGSSRRLQLDAEVIEALSNLDDVIVSGDGPLTRPRATLQPSHQRASMTSDLEIAMALQFEEGVTADAAVHERRGPHSESCMCLYAIELSRNTLRCFTCRDPIQRGTPRVLFMRPGRRQPSSVHTMCVTATAGLVQPHSGIPTPVFFDNRLGESDCVDVTRVLEQLPQADATALQPFLWPLPPRPPSRRSELRAQLLQSDRDFTAEDYELLLELDSHGGSGSSRASKEETDFKSALLARLPVNKLPNFGVDTQCSICLDVMESGSEVRTLPCMHMFHRHCIDRWLMTPGPPRCPVDQVEVQL